MFAWRKFAILGFALAISVSVVEGNEPRIVDLSKRQPDPAQRIVPFKMQEPKMLDGFTNQKFPVSKWHSKFSPLGTRRAPIAVENTFKKDLITPQKLEFGKVDLKMAPLDGRRAYVRNFDRLEEKKLDPGMRDARVTDVREMSTPFRTADGKTPSMRDVNRFTFSRNAYGDEPLKVQEAGAEGR